MLLVSQPVCVVKLGLIVGFELGYKGRHVLNATIQNAKMVVYRLLKCLQGHTHVQVLGRGRVTAALWTIYHGVLFSAISFLRNIPPYPHPCIWSVHPFSLT